MAVVELHEPAESPRARRMRLGYGSYQGMRSRCLCASHPYWYNYGGRGISICDRWLGRGGFDRFIEDLGPRPSPEHELDRIDSNGNYEPGNVRWATRKQNQRNRRNTPRVGGAGGPALRDFVEARLGDVPEYVMARITALGWGAERAVSEPRHVRGSYWRRRRWTREHSLYEPSFDEYVANEVLADLVEAFGPPVERGAPTALTLDEAQAWTSGLFDETDSSS